MQIDGPPTALTIAIEGPVRESVYRSVRGKNRSFAVAALKRMAARARKRWFLPKR